MNHSPAFLKIVNAAKERIQETDVAGVKGLQDEAVPFHLLDVREESEWARGRLPGAVHLGKGIIERDIESRFPDKNAHLVLYCGGGYRSALAADNLQQMGYTNVYSMDGGIRKWIESGFSVENG